MGFAALLIGGIPHLATAQVAATDVAGGPAPTAPAMILSQTTPNFTITSTFGSPTPGAGYTVATGTETPRLFRGGVVSTCASPKVCPGTFGSVSHPFDSYTFRNGDSDACVTVTLTQNSGTTFALFTESYAGSFNPSSLCPNYLAGPGFTWTISLPAVYSFNVPVCAVFVVVVNDVGGTAGGATYTLTVSDLSVTPRW